MCAQSATCSAREAGVGEANEGLGEEHQHDGGRGEHQRHKVEHGKEQPLSFGLFVPLPIAVQDSDKGDGDSSANQEVVHQVGQAKSGNVSIGLRARAKEPCDEFAADESDNAGEKRRRPPAGCSQYKAVWRAMGAASPNRAPTVKAR